MAENSNIYTPILKNFIFAGSSGSGGGGASVPSDPYFSSIVWLSSLDNSVTNEANSSATLALYNGASFSDAQSKFGTHSVFLDGTTHMIGLEGGRDIGTSVQFTLEGWFYPTASVVGSIVFSSVSGTNVAGASVNGGTYLWFQTAGVIKLYANNFERISVSTTVDDLVVQNQWNHIAITRDQADSFNLYINGSLMGQSSEQADAIDADYWRVGQYSGNTNYGFTGYVDELRFTYGMARYTTPSYTVPTEAFPNTGSDGSGNSALSILNFENNFVDEGSTGYIWSTDNPSVVATTTDSAKFGTHSLVINDANVDSGYLGVDNGLFLPSTPWTMQFWVNMSSLPTSGYDQYLCQWGTFSDATDGFSISVFGGATPRIYLRVNYALTGTTLYYFSDIGFNLNEWNHVVLQYDGGLLKMAVNGYATTGGYTFTNRLNSTRQFRMGWSLGSLDLAVPYYVDNFSLVEGVVYPEAFTVTELTQIYTPPTEPFPTA